MNDSHIDSNCCQGSLDKKRVYTSKFNELFLSDEIPKHVTVFDTTLRDGEQTPGVALSCADKVRIAKALDELGVDVIEVGFPAASQGEKDAVKAVMDLSPTSKICGLARCVKSDVDAVADSGLNYVHTFIATSDSHLKYKLKMTQETVLEKAVATIEYAKARGLEVEFSCEDATRTSLEFLKKMHIAVQEAGVDRINVPDTVGTISPTAMEYLIRELKTVTKVPISVHCHDDFGMAVANTLSAVRGGAEQIHATINGLGERAGNASLEEAVLALMAFYNVETSINTKMIGPTSKLVSRLFGYEIPPNKAIVGKNAFAHESGIHVHGVLSDPSTYEAFGPELVGVERNIVLGKHSGAHSIKEKLHEYGIELDDEQIAQIVEKIKDLADNGKEIDDAELVVLATHLAEQRQSKHINLDEFAVFTGIRTTPTAVVTLDINGEKKTGTSIGIGPVDAAINAINTVMGNVFTLEEYRLNAITGGSDSLCEVMVKIGKKGEGKAISVGKGVGSDIVQTSVDATMEALDRLYSRLE